VSGTGAVLDLGTTAQRGVCVPVGGRYSSEREFDGEQLWSGVQGLVKWRRWAGQRTLTKSAGGTVVLSGANDLSGTDGDRRWVSW
jgi:hypothetical protein